MPSSGCPRSRDFSVGQLRPHPGRTFEKNVADKPLTKKFHGSRVEVVAGGMGVGLLFLGRIRVKEEHR